MKTLYFPALCTVSGEHRKNPDFAHYLAGRVHLSTSHRGSIREG